MNHIETRLEDFLKEVGFGEVKLQVLDEKVILIPRQKICRPKKFEGVRVEITIDEPLYLLK